METKLISLSPRLKEVARPPVAISTTTSALSTASTFTSPSSTGTFTISTSITATSKTSRKADEEVLKFKADLDVYSSAERGPNTNLILDKQIRMLEQEFLKRIPGFVEKYASIAVESAAPASFSGAEKAEIAGDIKNMEPYLGAGYIFLVMEAAQGKEEDFKAVTSKEFRASVRRNGTEVAAARVYAARITHNFSALTDKRLSAPETTSFFDALGKEAASEVYIELGKSGNFRAISALWDQSIAPVEEVLGAIKGNAKVAGSLAAGLATTNNEGAFLNTLLLKSSEAMGPVLFSDVLDWARISGRPSEYTKQETLKKLISGELNPAEPASNVATSGNETLLIVTIGDNQHDIRIKGVAQRLQEEEGLRIAYRSNLKTQEEIQKEVLKIRSGGHKLHGVVFSLSEDAHKKVVFDTLNILRKEVDRHVKLLAGGVVSQQIANELERGGVKFVAPGTDFGDIAAFLRRPDGPQLRNSARDGEGGRAARRRSKRPASTLGDFEDEEHAEDGQGTTAYYTAGCVKIGGCGGVEFSATFTWQSANELGRGAAEEAREAWQRREELRMEREMRAWMEQPGNTGTGPNPAGDGAANQTASGTAGATSTSAAGMPSSDSLYGYFCPTCKMMAIPPHSCPMGVRA